MTYSKEDQALIDQVNADYEAVEGEQRLWRWFGLGRPSWLTMPRVLMHEMPSEWQDKMARLLEEFDEEFPKWCPGQLYVQLKDNGRYSELPRDLCEYRHPHNLDHYRRAA